MFRYQSFIWTTLAIIFLCAGQVSAGWVIDQVMKGDTESSRQQVVLQANRMKTLVLGEGGRPAAAFILDLDARTITQVDYQKRFFATATVQEYSQMIRDAQQAAAEKVGQAMKAMQEALKEMPPEQRQMVEQMMRSGPAPQECREPKVEMLKRGEQATIAGYSAIRYDVLVDGKLDSELWIAKGITAWSELDPGKLERIAAELGKLSGCGPSQKPQGLLGADPTWKLSKEGYPVRTVDRNSGGRTIEVVRAEHRTVPLEEFQPPSGFIRKTLLELMEQ